MLTSKSTNDQTVRPLALWTAPRTSSNAFLRMMVERGDHTVLHEPFEMAYYLGPQRCSSRYDFETSILQPHETFSTALARVVDAAKGSEKPLFFKEAAFQLGPLLTRDFFKPYRNAILVRHPAYLVPSLAKVWSDYQVEETGFAALHETHCHLCSLSRASSDVPVIDGTDLVVDPPGIVRAFCKALHIPYIAEALTWENGQCDAWAFKSMWDSFRISIVQTRGLVQRPEPPFPKVDERSARVIDAMRPLYEEIVANKLKPV